MKLLKSVFTILLLLACYGWLYASSGSLSDRGEKLLQQEKADSAGLYGFADMCLKADSTGKFILTYKALINKKAWRATPADLPLLDLFYATIDTARPLPTDLIICQQIIRIFLSEHIDQNAPLRYLAAEMAIARRMPDKCQVALVYKHYTSFYMNVRHDMLKVYETIKELEAYGRDNNIVFKDCHVNVNIAWVVFYYYLQDYDKCIEYADNAIKEFGPSNNNPDLLDMYVVKSMVQLLEKKFAAALISLDSARLAVRDLKDRDRFLNDLQADSFNVYLDWNDMERAKVLKDKVDISKLGKRNDEFYDYTYRLIKYCTYSKDYENALQLVDMYKVGLKPWNIQRWCNLYDASYRLNRAMGNLTQALSDYENYTMYNDSVHHQTKHYVVMAQQIKFHTLQKEEELKLQLSVNEVQSKNIKLVISVSITVCLLLLLVLFYRTNKGLRERERLNKAFAQRLMENTEQTQTRLAHELHDGLGQELLLLRNGLAMQKDTRHTEAVSGIIENVRSMARELYPALLDVVGLKATIENQLQKIDETEDIFISAEIELEQRPDKQTELQVYRIFQEAVTNVLKYAGATSLYVSLHGEDKLGRLVVKDNGKGFDVEAQMKDPNTFGLKNMQQRAESINGHLTITSVVGKGTEICLIFTIHENTDS